MATPLSSHLFCSYHEGQKGNDDYHDWQLWQNSHMQAPVLPMHAHEGLQIGTVVRNMPGLMEVQNSFNMSAAGFETQFSGVANHVDAFHGSNGTSDTMLLERAPATMVDYRFGEWNLDTSSATFPNKLANPSSVFYPDGHLAVNQIMQTDLSGFGGLGYESMGLGGNSNLLSDDLLLANPGGRRQHPPLVPVKRLTSYSPLFNSIYPQRRTCSGQYCGRFRFARLAGRISKPFNAPCNRTSTLEHTFGLHGDSFNCSSSVAPNRRMGSLTAGWHDKHRIPRASK